MGKWREGIYNPNYVVHKKGLISQLKFESTTSPARLEEISIEKYDNGDKCVVFTTDLEAKNDKKHGGIHARLAYNGLFKDLSHFFTGTNCSFTSDADEVHCVRAKKGDENILRQLLMRLEEYDNSLAEISSKLIKAISPDSVHLNDIEKEIENQKERLSLLNTVFTKAEARKG